MAAVAAVVVAAAEVAVVVAVEDLAVAATLLDVEALQPTPLFEEVSHAPDLARDPGHIIEPNIKKKNFDAMLGI